jgi:hypothetical protein
MLLYLVKHSRLDIGSSVRELSEVADGATIGHWKLLPGCIEYIITIEYLALKLKPNAIGPSFDMEWLQEKDGRVELEGVSVSEFAADQETIISVLVGICIFVKHWLHENQRQVIAGLYHQQNPNMCHYPKSQKR